MFSELKLKDTVILASVVVVVISGCFALLSLIISAQLWWAFIPLIIVIGAVIALTLYVGYENDLKAKN